MPPLRKCHQPRQLGILLSTAAEFFFLYYHRSIHLPFNLCIKDTDFDTLPKQGHTNRYVLSTDQFLKTVLWLYCDNQPFSSPNGPFIEPYRAEMEIWSPRLFFYTCTNVSAAQHHKFPMGENWPQNSKPKKNKKQKTHKQTKKNSIIRMSSFSLYDSMHGQYVNSRDGFATIEFFFK